MKLLHVLYLLSLATGSIVLNLDAQNTFGCTIPATKEPLEGKDLGLQTQRLSRKSRHREHTYVNPTAGDFTAGEDPFVRHAAVKALGKLNGSVLVVDAHNGRILTMVNQKVALSSGYIPCSTIKLVVGFAALSEGIVRSKQKVWFDGYWFMNMVNGLAISNNVYFEHLGRTLGFDCLKHYATHYGFGEKAGLGISGEHLGKFPEQEPPSGVARMSSFGEGITITPLQMAAFMAAIANGGTLYYLQAPRKPSEWTVLKPVVKRHLVGVRWLPEIRSGMLESVNRGTGQRAKSTGLILYGKTGTCSQRHHPGKTYVGWFACFNGTSASDKKKQKQLTIVVMLKGGPLMHGSRAAEIAGNIYQTLGKHNYFSMEERMKTVTASETQN